MNREDFPMLSYDYIYFDNGATTFKPQIVIDKMNDYYQNYSANIHRSDYDISFQADLEYENVRELTKKFINAHRNEEIIFTSGTTESLNMITNGFFNSLLEPGDEILLTQSEHASNVIPWLILAKKTGCVIKYIPLNERYELTMDNIQKMITPKTKVISIAHITNVIGDIRPIKEITSLAHANNIFVVLDAAQSVAHLKIDVIDLDVDFMCFSGHKMYGPTGVGVLYGKEKLLNNLIPINYGGGMNESFDDVNSIVLKDLPHRLEAGTPNIAGVIGLGAAINYLTTIGLDKIQNYEQELKDYLLTKLNMINHLDIINSASNTGIIAFNVEDVFSQDVAFYLNKYHVCVRAGNHCAKILKQSTGVNNTVRISLALYNTKEEIDDVIMLLQNKEKIIEGMI